MTSPITQITVQCPKCGNKFQDSYRASMNLDLDDFDEEYVVEMSSSVCPKCHHKFYLDSMLVKDDVFYIDPMIGETED